MFLIYSSETCDHIYKIGRRILYARCVKKGRLACALYYRKAVILKSLDSQGFPPGGLLLSIHLYLLPKRWSEKMTGTSRAAPVGRESSSSGRGGDMLNTGARPKSNIAACLKC